MRSPVVKVNAALSRLPTFTAAGSVEPHRAMVTVTHGLDAAQEAFEAAERGEPAVAWAELYFQTAYDPSVAPPGAHVMSAFAQYAPYELAEGDWDGRRDEIGEQVDRPDRRPMHLTFASASSRPRCSVRPTSRSGSASPAATSSRARRSRTRCGTGGSSRVLRLMASTSVARPPTRRVR